MYDANPDVVGWIPTASSAHVQCSQPLFPVSIFPACASCFATEAMAIVCACTASLTWLVVEWNSQGTVHRVCPCSFLTQLRSQPLLRIFACGGLGEKIIIIARCLVVAETVLAFRSVMIMISKPWVPSPHGAQLHFLSYKRSTALTTTRTYAMWSLEGRIRILESRGVAEGGPEEEWGLEGGTEGLGESSALYSCFVFLPSLFCV